MKHDLRITLLLVLFFIVSQIVGLALLGIDMKGVAVNPVTGEKEVVHPQTALGERPALAGAGAFIYVVIGVAIGTALVLLLIKLKQVNIWKVWFFLAVFVAMSLAIGVLTKSWIAFAIALVLSLIKIVWPNVFVHNLTEVLMYSGIAIFLVPLFKVEWAFLMLVAISIYDFIAVFKSKHMVKMAEFQSESKVFAGLFIPYVSKDGRDARRETSEMQASLGIKQPSRPGTSSGAGKNTGSLKVMRPVASKAGFAAEKKNAAATNATANASLDTNTRNAILGGGDIAFPLLFTGAVMESLVLKGASVASAFTSCLIITATATIALAGLFIYAKKDKFYPAMPILSAGCFVGYGLIVLLTSALG